MTTFQHNGARVPAPIALDELSERPIISIIVANYNYGHYLPDMVQSVLDQTYANWELIICDDGSIDGSQEILRELADRDGRIIALYKENGGQASAWNLAWQHANGEIICLLDSDDWFESKKLELVVRAFAAHPTAGLAHHRMQPTDAERRAIGPPIPHELHSGWLYPVAIRDGGHVFVTKPSELCMRREIADLLFPIPADVWGDGYISRLALFLTEVAAIPEVLSAYRIHGNSDFGLGYIDLLRPASIEKWASAHLVAVDYQKRFLTNHFDDRLADQIVAEESPYFQDLLGRLYLLRGKPSRGVMGYAPSEVRNHLGRSRKWLLWRLCFAIPHPLSLWLVSAQVQVFEKVRSLRRYVVQRRKSRHQRSSHQPLKDTESAPGVRSEQA